ncbi:response regulator [Pedobacter sp. Du54]|uniref:response regulator n=1 Tax=Pedobacter anseongensis TaxID=3133439 RepID=UPI0030AD3C74
MEYKNKVMIVDDNPIDQLITEYILKLNHEQGDIIVMKSANDALNYLALHANSPESLPSLIFLDLDMPVMNGFDFLQRFKEYADEVKERCRIVVVTASEAKADIERMRSDPHVIKLVAKPLHRHSLVL